jgi:hypothetical protein
MKVYGGKHDALQSVRVTDPGLQQPGRPATIENAVRSSRCLRLQLRFVALWRNWQTQQTQNLPRFTPRIGSTPIKATKSFALAKTCVGTFRGMCRGARGEFGNRGIVKSAFGVSEPKSGVEGQAGFKRFSCLPSTAHNIRDSECGERKKSWKHSECPVFASGTLDRVAGRQNVWTMGCAR